MSYSSAQGGPRIVKEGLILHLDAASPKSYPGSGNIWYDLTKYGQNVTLYNSPTFSNLGLGSLLFNGTNQNGIVTLSPDITNSPFSISVWLRPTSNTFSTLIGLGTILGPTQYYQLQVFRPFVGEFYFDDYSNAIFSSVPNLLNNWYNFTVTLDSSFLAKGYVNGVFVDDNTFAGYLSTTSKMSIANIDFFGGVYWYTGYVSQLMVYNRTINANEVAQNFSALGPRFGYY